MEYYVKYLIGYPGWDKPDTVKLVINKGAMRITQPISTGKNLVIDAKDIIDVSFERQTKRSGTRAATGALVGGLLTGGIGLLAGAAVGAKAKDKSELTILFNENGRERLVTLQTKDKTNAIFNALQDAVAYRKEHPDEELDLKTEMEKMKEDPKKEGDTVLGCVLLIIILVVFIYFVFIK